MAEEATERVSVSTYVPAYQRERWREHADALDMSQSEFVRTMVQAGRREFGLADDNETESPEGGGDSGPDPRGERLKSRVVARLRERPHGWDELVAAVTDDVESRLEATLEDLQDENRIRHRPREGGYALVDDGE